jgi:hypothetical protein
MDDVDISSNDEIEIEGVDEAERRRERAVDVVEVRFDEVESDNDKNVRFCSFSSL